MQRGKNGCRSLVADRKDQEPTLSRGSTERFNKA
jgi:hypothetical protein